MDTVTTDTPTLTASVDSRPSGADAVALADVTTADDAALVEDELLVEEVSIDGMCGVY